MDMSTGPVVDPEEWGALLSIGRLHGAGVEEHSVSHDPLDVLRVANVRCWIMVLLDHADGKRLP